MYFIRFLAVSVPTEILTEDGRDSFFQEESPDHQCCSSLLDNDHEKAFAPVRVPSPEASLPSSTPERMLKLRRSLHEAMLMLYPLVFRQAPVKLKLLALQRLLGNHNCP